MHKPTRTSLRRAPRFTRSEPKATVQKARTITEDQADILYCEKHKHEKGIPLREALRELGIDESEVGL